MDNTAKDIFIFISLLIAIASGIISLAYLWLKLKRLDTHVMFLLSLNGLQKCSIIANLYSGHRHLTYNSKQKCQYLHLDH